MDASHQSNDKLTYKVLMLGEAGVGKTALVRRYAHKLFKEDYKATLGIDMTPKTILKGNSETILLQIWDFSGQALFGNLRSRFYTGAAGVLLVYDVTQDHSFQKLERWYEELVSNIGKASALVVGNKFDLALLRQVSNSEADQFALSLGTTHHLASAKTGQHVESVFSILVDKIIDGSSDSSI